MILIEWIFMPRIDSTIGERKVYEFEILSQSLALLCFATKSFPYDDDDRNNFVTGASVLPFCPPRIRIVPENSEHRQKCCD